MQDFDGFCERVSQLLPFAVRRMIRGHDHVDERERYAVQDKYVKHPMLTINNLCHRLARELFGPFERVPCVARYVRDELPEVHLLDIPADVIRRVYPTPETNDA